MGQPEGLIESSMALKIEKNQFVLLKIAKNFSKASLRGRQKRLTAPAEFVDPRVSIVEAVVRI